MCILACLFVCLFELSRPWIAFPSFFFLFSFFVLLLVVFMDVEGRNVNVVFVRDYQSMWKTFSSFRFLIHAKCLEFALC